MEVTTMVNQTTIRQKLQTKVFERFGITATFINKSSPTYNNRGEIEDYTETSSQNYIVPYNIFNDTQTYQEFGNLNEGEMDAAVPHDVSLSIDDEITFKGETWLVKNIQPNYLPNNVVTIIRIVRKQG